MSGEMKVHEVGWTADDFLSGTIELDDAECGVYIRLISLVYSRNRPVTRDLLKQTCKSHGNAFNRIVAKLIEAGKIIEDGREMTVKRCEKELKKARKHLRNLRQFSDEVNENNEVVAPVGAALARVVTDSDSSLKPKKERKKESESRISVDREFEEVWKLFPRKRDKGHALIAFRAARKITELAVVIEGIKRFALESADKDPKFIAYPASWLNGKRWLDEEAADGDGADLSFHTGPRGPAPQIQNGQIYFGNTE
jgi:uncharacterized protein YdaU (DUF1376 family)